ncbi:MAG: hypothetical protein JO009_06390 [Candidatus Eremiobacteraeota bacterium]|nr:hypothetical protein [Candidatus Eremiobacteraeota bacterium]
MTFRWVRTLVAIAVVLAAIGSIAFAATSPTIESTPVPKPAKPDFSSMNWLLGTWNCSFKSGRRPSAASFIQVTTMDPSGYWMVTKSVSKGTSWFPWPANSTDMVTHDSDPKRWVDIMTGDFGAYDASSSPGWNGDTIVWTDNMFKPSSDVMAVTPLTQTKVSPRKWTSHTTFQERSSGTWISVDTMCNKTL